MFAKPQQEHQWLEQLVGNWTVEQQCTMPDGNQVESSGRMSCRMIGGLWLLAESTGVDPEGNPWTCVMTLGFDPAKEAFIGTFLGSMMTHLWPYHGRRDPSGNRLPLDSEGPKFDGSGTTRYRDTLEIVSPNEWLFDGEVLSDDGTWVEMMHGRHRRTE